MSRRSPRRRSPTCTGRSPWAAIRGGRRPDPLDDYGETLDDYRAKGLEITCEFFVEGAPPVTYVDTVAEFGFFTEVAGWTDAFVAHLTQVADAGPRWRGS